VAAKNNRFDDNSVIN